MIVPAGIFREYDVRGIIDRELTPDVARALGRAFASAARDRRDHPPVIAVGRDNRPSGAVLAAAARRGITEAGATALDLGVVPTPALYFAVTHFGADGGLQVTGSHNPPEFNGFKMVLGGESLHGSAIRDLRARIEAEEWRTGSGREESRGGVLEAYREAIVSRHQLARSVRVVVDCGNGTASLIAESVLQALGCEVTGLFCESDGTFPNHHPDPTVPENLQALVAEVRRSGAELGIAFDGDGDRLGAVDETGRIVFGDQLLILFGRDAVHRHGVGVPVIFDVKCSEVLPRALEAAGARPVMWKTGHSLIKARMRELEAPLAGEMSGHIFFGGDYYGYDDALFAAARLLEIVSRGRFGLAALLSDVPETFATPEIRVDCPDEIKFEVVARAARHFGARYRVNTIDGVRIQYPDGWALLRPSNTQPVLVMRFEASTPEGLAASQHEIRAWLAEQGIAP